MTSMTTTALRLPPPTRTSVLLPHPEARTMPKPNRAPPTAADSQSQRLPPWMVLAGSITPAKAITAKPAMATPIASPHWRMRVQSPMFTTSLTAPIVQKWVRWTMAPNRRERKKVAPSTWVPSAEISGDCMPGF